MNTLSSLDSMLSYVLDVGDEVGTSLLHQGQVLLVTRGTSVKSQCLSRPWGKCIESLLKHFPNGGFRLQHSPHGTLLLEFVPPQFLAPQARSTNISRNHPMSVKENRIVMVEKVIHFQLLQLFRNTKKSLSRASQLWSFRALTEQTITAQSGFNPPETAGSAFETLSSLDFRLAKMICRDGISWDQNSFSYGAIVFPTFS